MQNKILVSIIMPAYNSERFINESIDSILNQTHSNIELLIYDDGSTDSTRSIIDSYSDGRIKKIYASKNSGVVEARNQLIDHAKGEYIALMDSDDIASRDRIQKQLRFLSQGSCDICGSGQWNLNQTTGKLKASKDRYSDADLRALLTIYCTLCNSAVMARASIFKQFKYDVSMLIAEDYYLWTQLAAAGYRFGNLKNRLITYRQYPEQSSSRYVEMFQISSSEVISKYLNTLGIPNIFFPKPTKWCARALNAPQFLFVLNQKIPGISFTANCELYARFQYRKNKLWTIFTRPERWFFCLTIWLWCKSKKFTF